MSLLEPNWSQDKPSPRTASEMCGTVQLVQSHRVDGRCERVLARLRETHSNGGAFLGMIEVRTSEVFDWFASRNRLLENDILPQLLLREEIRTLLPALKIPEEPQKSTNQDVCSFQESRGFRSDNPFLLDGQLAARLCAGGAYSSQNKITGRAAMQLASDYCEAAFQRRYEEVSLYSSYTAWTPWFAGIAWDWTSVVFDRRERKLWVLVVTDED